MNDHPLYLAARSAHGAADALVAADAYASEPILADEADAKRAAAREALLAALRQLDEAA